MSERRDPQELFERALELDDRARSEFLARLAEVDPRLARDVRSLVVAHDAHPSFLDGGLDAQIRTFFGGGALDGQRVGEYEIVRELGSGGMGIVCLARRAGEFEHTVAIKFAHWGVSTEQLESLGAERAILARLRHPGIAQLYGGGTIGGRPYLVMEYVEGEPITDYCERRDLPVAARLDLMQSVCDAVQFAHQNLIVHRDLKPSNILVTEGGQVKLLDFGIAKLLRTGPQPSYADGPPTVAAFTPAYSAPEQLRREPVTTTADVFALGVITYELLTGEHPFPVQGLSMAEVERFMCDREPAAPSTTVARSTGGVTIDHDVDRIVLKALRKEPHLRYESPRALADDIKRYLRGLPVLARTPTARYRASKFLRRNRIGVASAAVVTTALVGALALTTWQGRIATDRALEAAQERDRARAATARSERVNSFLQGVLATANPSWYVDSDANGPDVTVLQALEEAARRMESELADDPEVRADIHHTLGDTYRALLDQERMVYHFTESLALRREVFQSPHPKVAEGLYYLSAAHSRGGEWSRAEELLREGLAMQRARDEGNNLPFMVRALATFETASGHLDRAVALQRESVEMFRARFGPDHPYYPTVAVGGAQLSEAYLQVGDLSRAALWADSSSTGTDTWYGMRAVGLVRAAEGRFTEAEARFRRSLDLGGPEPRVRSDLALWVMIPQGRLGDARAELTEAAGVWESEGPNRPVSLQQRLLILATLAYLYALEGDAQSAETDARGVQEELASIVSVADLDYFWDTRQMIQAALGRAYVVGGRPADARPLLLGNLEALDRRGARGPLWVRANADLAVMYEAMGDADAQERHASLALGFAPVGGGYDFDR